MTINERAYASDAPLQSGVTPAVQWLIAANVVVYFLQLTIFGEPAMTSWFALSAEQFPDHWWAVATYMFVHAGLVHLGTNMLMLWMFGPRVERAFGTRSFCNFYFWCGLGGAVFHLLFVRQGAVIGASGAVVGVVLAYALRWPDDEVYLFGVVPIKARWLAVWMIAANVGMALADMTGYTSSGTAWMTHVGGLVFAWIYLHAPYGTGLERLKQHVATVPDEQRPQPIPKTPRNRRHEHPQTADEAVARSNAMAKRRAVPQQSSQTPSATVRKPKRKLDEVNALLDKISRGGINSLTPAERTILEELSRRLRNS
jgi:membrane associated rhomboid family serine protease